MKPSRFSILILLLVACAAPAASAQSWWDSHYAFRRPVDVNWDSAHGNGGDLAQLEFFTAGHVNPSGDDIRVTTADGKLLAIQTLMVGPGDTAHCAFMLEKNVRKYYVYFGNQKPVPPPKPVGDVKFDRGILLETRAWIAGRSEQGEAMKDAFNQSKSILGKLLIDRPFYGLAPFGDQNQTISRYSGQLAAPVDGDYTFAAAIASRGALFIDGKLVVFARHAPGDTRYHNTINLKRGRHDFDVYQIHDGGDPRVSIGWQRPDMTKIEEIGRDAFGIVAWAIPGPMEAFQHRITADFKLEYEGECFVEGNYSHRYKFTAELPPDANGYKVKWDFGDDLTSDQPVVEHVFLTAGIYPIRLTVSQGNFTDVQTTRLAVERDFQNLDHPRTDPAALQSNIVESYDVAKMPSRWLRPAALLLQRAGRNDAMLAVASRIASDVHHDDNHALTFLQDLTEKTIDHDPDKTIAMWDLVPSDSDMQPRAARYHAQLLMWWTADFDKAVKTLQPFADSAKKDTYFQRVYGEALILDQKVDQGERILRGLPVRDDPRRQAAMSGAMARSTEYYIDQHDWQTGEETWSKWAGMYPSVFLEGYSVLLRTRLMEIKKAPTAAAKVAEAFALAEPNSSYAPALLDRASKLLAKSDPEKSKSLHELLKKRYPEDPLSQN